HPAWRSLSPSGRVCKATVIGDRGAKCAKSGGPMARLLPGTAVRVRRGRRHDLPGVQALLAAPADDRLERVFRRILADLGTDLYVAEDERGEIVGLVSVLYARSLARGGGYAEELAPEEAAALVASAFRFFSAPGPELRVRAVTPEYASDGWDAPVSVIETVMPDRAFIVDTIRSRLERAGVPVRALLHPIFAARRDPSGRLELLADP